MKIEIQQISLERDLESLDALINATYGFELVIPKDGGNPLYHQTRLGEIRDRLNRLLKLGQGFHELEITE